MMTDELNYNASLDWIMIMLIRLVAFSNIRKCITMRLEVFAHQTTSYHAVVYPFRSFFGALSVVRPSLTEVTFFPEKII